MSAIAVRKLTEEEYLAIERAASFKSDFFQGEMFAMAGASIPHNRIKDNLVRHLGNQLDGSGCLTYSSDQRVKIKETGLYCYPDVIIVCGKAEVIFNDVIVNPTIIIEVLSPSTEIYDRNVKLRHYRKVESVREIVILSQREPVIEVYTRHTPRDWLSRIESDLNGFLELTSVPVTLPIAAIYEGVTFEPIPLEPPPENLPGGSN